MSRNCTLNSEFGKIEEWGRANRVEFNTRKTQCCLLSHKRISDPGQNVCILGTSIRSDLRWDHHFFNVSKEEAKCLGVLKRCKKYFIPSDLRTILERKWNAFYVYGQVRKSALDFVNLIQSRALKMIRGDIVTSSITSLGHRRNVSCIVLFYK